MDRKAQEYGYLKQEILDSIGYTKQYRSILYTVTAAILTFAFTQHEPCEPKYQWKKSDSETES